MSPARDHRTVVEALDTTLNVGALKKLAALFPARAPSRKAELVTHLASCLAGDGLRAVWDRLDELQRAAIAEVVHGPHPTFDMARFRAKYGRDPEWGSLDEYKNDAKPSLLRLFFYGAGVMPDDLKAQFRTFVPTPPSAAMTSLEELPAAFDRPLGRCDTRARAFTTDTESIPLTLRETERPAQYDLFAVLRLIGAGKVSVSDKTRRPTAATVKAVAEVLVRGDFYDAAPNESDGEPGPIKAFAWPLLVQAARLAEVAGSRLRLTKAGEKARSLPPATTLRTVWQRWLDTTLFDELARIDCIKGQTGNGKRGLTAVAGRRAAIRDALADCPAGRWIVAAELFRYMRAAGHDFEVTRDPWKLYVSDPHYGSLGHGGFHGWDILQARYARCVLFEYAATLGIVDVAYIAPADAQHDFRRIWGTDELAFFSRYDGLTHLRVTSFGAHCLNDAEYAAEPAPEVAGRPAAERDERLVNRGTAQLFECESPALAARIVDDPRMRRLCLLAGDRYLAVPAKSAAGFQRALEKLGLAGST